MIPFSPATRIYLAAGATDLRKSFEGLSDLVTHQFKEDPLSGHLYVFANRKRNRIKLLYFDGTGVCVLAKRLEQGTFHWPQSAGEPGAKLRLTPQALQLLLDGVDLRAGARRAWYEHPA